MSLCRFNKRGYVVCWAAKDRKHVSRLCRAVAFLSNDDVIWRQLWWAKRWNILFHIECVIHILAHTQSGQTASQTQIPVLLRAPLTRRIFNRIKIVKIQNFNQIKNRRVESDKGELNDCNCRVCYDVCSLDLVGCLTVLMVGGWLVPKQLMKCLQKMLSTTLTAGLMIQFTFLISG